MKFVILITSSPLRDKVLELFDKLGITSYTIIPDVLGAGRAGGIRFNDEVWPGTNYLFFTACNDELAYKIKEWVQEYRNKKIREGLKYISLKVEELL